MNLKCKRTTVQPIRTIKYKKKKAMVKETGQRHGTKPNLLLFLAIASVYSTDVHALPEGPTTVYGSANIATINGNNITINQSTNKAIINWQKFGISLGESVKFNQLDRSSIALNRVTGSQKSVIEGALSANGQVFILNPNGLIFGSSALFTVGGLWATTFNMET
jgi:filamentous hemagglutinin family protein